MWAPARHRLLGGWAQGDLFSSWHLAYGRRSVRAGVQCWFDPSLSLLSAFTVLGPVYDRHLEGSPTTRGKTERILGRLPSLGSVQAQGASVLKQKMPS